MHDVTGRLAYPYEKGPGDVRVLISTLCCLAVPRVTRQETNVSSEPKPDRALVYFYRESKFVDAATSYTIKQDDKVIGALANGTYYFPYDVEPGTLTLTFTANTDGFSHADGRAREDLLHFGRRRDGLFGGTAFIEHLGRREKRPAGIEIRDQAHQLS